MGTYARINLSPVYALGSTALSFVMYMYLCLLSMCDFVRHNYYTSTGVLIEGRFTVIINVIIWEIFQSNSFSLHQHSRKVAYMIPGVQKNYGIRNFFLTYCEGRLLNKKL